MPEEDKKMVPIDTSGPDATIDIEEKKGNNFNNWLAHGTKCPICLGKSFPPDMMKIRKLHNKFGFTYKELSKRAHYSYQFVMDIVRGAKGTDETIKLLADIAEEMAKEKETREMRRDGGKTICHSN